MPWSATPPARALVEMTLNGPQLTALRPLVVACAGLGGALEVDGEVVGWQTVRSPPAPGSACAAPLVARAPTSRRRRLEVRTVLGSASTDVRGLIGRALMPATCSAPPADVSAGRPAAARPAGPRPRPADPPPARTRSTTRRRWPRSAPAPSRVGVGDRIGVRLDGPPVPGGEILSESPPLGALQVTPAGVPIILLADRLRTAGYTKPAVVHPEDIGRVAQLRAGDPVSFVALPAPEHGWYLDLT